MSNNFDWKTEDDFDWDELPEDTPSDPSPDGRRRLLSLLLIIIVLAALAAGAMRLVDQRVDDNTQAMREDIVSSQNLLRAAEAEQDDELFFSLLSGRDGAWTAAQHELFQAQALQDRSPFGLELQPTAPYEIEQDERLAITFSPDLLTAEVVTTLPFEIEIGNGLTETITLANVSVFRLGQERWLLAPPDQAFWGEQSTARESKVTLTYPARDAEIAERLADDLDRKLGEVCSTLPSLACQRDLRLDIKLSTSPQSLVDAVLPRAADENEGTLSFALPAPTLVGVPQDERGYQALFRGYAAQMATALIARQVGYECCDQLPFFQALIDRQLSQLALKPWPGEAVNYARVLNEQVRLHDLMPLWQSDDPADLYGEAGWRVFTAIDYLLNSVPDADGDATVLQRELVRHNSYFGWLNGLFAGEEDFARSALISDLTRGFWLPGYEETLRTDAEWGTQAPNQALYATCSVRTAENAVGRVTTLYRFGPAAGAWDDLYRTNNLLWINALPGDELLLQQEFSYGEGRWATNIREGNEQRPLLTESAAYTVSFGQTDPAVNGLAAFVFPAEGDDATITWFDLQDCSDNQGCAHWELPGIPIWSPDGEQAVFTTNPAAQLDLLQLELRTMLFDRRARNESLPIHIASRADLLGDSPATDVASLRQLANGHAPFWIDSETIGYVTGAGSRQRSNRAMAVKIDESAPQQLFTLSELLSHVDHDLDAERLSWIHYVMVHPDNPDRLFPVVFSEVNQHVHVFSYTRSTGAIQDLMTAGYAANHSFGLSPDGRYLVLAGADLDDPGNGEESALLQVYDLERDRVFPFLTLTADFPPFAIYDWSADGNWLALLLDDNQIGFFAPNQELLQLATLPPGRCGTPAWMNQ